MNKRKINYVKHWVSDGTVYSQTVNITVDEFNRFLKADLKDRNTCFKINK